jgi:hypothetical protein
LDKGCAKGTSDYPLQERFRSKVVRAAKRGFFVFKRFAMALLEPEAYAGESYAGTDTFVEQRINEFLAQHQDLVGGENRAPLAIELAEGLRDSGDILSLKTKIQIDTIQWVAWNHLWQLHHKSKYIRAEEYAAKERLFNDIDRRSRAITNEAQAYDDLVDEVHTAWQVVKNPSGLAAFRENNQGTVDQLLSVHRVIKVLKPNGFTKARRGDIEELRRGAGVVVPLGKLGSRLIPLVIQPGSRALNRLETHPTDSVIYVNIPFSSVREHPFTMSTEDAATLLETVKLTRDKKLMFGSTVNLKRVA